MARRHVSATLLLAAVLFVSALSGYLRKQPQGLAACPTPFELESHDGHTTAVGCHGHGPPVRGPARRLFGLPIDPNTADARTLESLPRIGPARAEAIVRAREREAFGAVRELLRVPGIGPATLAAIEPFLSVDGAGLQQNR